MTFASLSLSAPLLRAVEAQGYACPTPIQVAAIPAILQGRDVWASAKTGSGKTAAFVLPMLQILGEGRRGVGQRVRALIVVPTRELAMQIGEVVRRFSRAMPAPLKTCVVVGGVSKNPQRMDLRGGADLVIATPGRLLDLAADNALRLDDLELLVLDEADQLLSLGFSDELARLLAMLPRRQNLLFSATFPEDVCALASRILDAPVRIEADPAETLRSGVITQRVIEVDTAKRTRLLRHLLEVHGWSQALVFVSSRHAAEHVADKVKRAGIEAAALHGDLSQGARTKALADFKSKQTRLLIATDVAARGIDVPQLPAVINYDLPRSSVDYVHRVGRTGRAGESGTAISFVTADSAAHFRLIEKRHHLSLERERLPGFEPSEVSAESASPSPLDAVENAPLAPLDVVENAPPAPLDVAGGVKGRRKSKKDKLREAAARAAAVKS